MIDRTTGIKGNISVKGASVGATTVGVASGIADGDNADAFAYRAASVGIVGGGRMIDSTAGIEVDVFVKGASVVGNTVVIVASGDARGANHDAAFVSGAVGVETDFCNATRDDERLPFCPFHRLACLNDPWSL